MQKWIWFILLAVSCTSKQQLKDEGGLSPEAALKSLSVAPGFTVELFAAEPLIADPVAMEVDESGNMYVVEMHGYPLDKSGSGKVKVLKDVNADGLPDKAIVFAKDLTLPSGIMRWKKGVLVTDMPNLLYLEDSNGDDVADIRDTIITGMALSNPQHNGNTPVYGPDNWIYIAHETSITPVVYTKEFGDEGQPIRFVKGGHKATLPLNANGRNIRLKPEQGKLEMCSGETQFGQTFDPRGHHFSTANANHVFHEAIAARYLQQNPALEVGGATADIPDHGNAAKVFPITKDPHIELLTDVGVITSSCGITWYQGGLFPDSFNQVTFIAEPVHNLVHADKVIDNGASFQASRVYADREFLASTDPWFRPVQFYIGPDGAMYVIDYYRKYIEHPEWMSEEVAASGQLYSGHTKGRIYRITPNGKNIQPWLGKPLIDTASVASMAQALNSSNVWWRRHAQRLLVDRGDRDADTAMRAVLNHSTSPATTMAAFWTLEGLSLLDTNMVADALQHPDAGVRETAIKLAEHFLPNAGLEEKLAKLAHDPDVKVRYQLLCTASFFGSEQNIGAGILDKNLNDHWFRIAALATYHGREEQLLAKMLKNEKEGAAEMIASISALICLQKNEKGLNELLGLMNAKNSSTSATVAMVQGIAMVPDLAQHLAPAIRQKIIGTISKYIVPSSPASIRDASVGLLLALQASGDEVLVQKIKDALLKPTPQEGYLASCIALSAIYPSIWSQELATRFMQPDQPVEIQTATIHAFARTGPSAMQWLLNQWKGLTVPVRKAVLEQSMQDSISTSLLLGKLATGDITSSAIPWSTQVSLMNHEIIPIRKKAREQLTKNTGGRDEALKAYEPALKLEGDPAKGATIFAKNCSVCHQVGNMDGIAFGPDLASVANRDPYFILSDIIKPDRSIADGYEWWEITLRNGNTVSGIIASETATAIALRDPSGSTKMINRSQISSLQASPNSVMPAGLEQNMTVAEMAHLLAFLKKPSQ